MLVSSYDLYFITISYKLRTLCINNDNLNIQLTINMKNNYFLNVTYNHKICKFKLKFMHLDFYVIGL